MRRAASTKPTRSISNIAQRGKLLTRRLRPNANRSTRSTSLSRLSKTDRVERDLVLSIQMRRDFDVCAGFVKLVQISDVVLQHAVFGGMREINVVRIGGQRRERLIEIPKRFRQLRSVSQKNQLFVKSPIQTDDGQIRAVSHFAAKLI